MDFMMKNCLLCMSLVFAGCAGHVTSSLQVDGAPFAATTCRAGQASGFSGVELSDDHGQRLRLAQNLDGSFAGAYFPSGSPIGDNLGACGTLNVQPGFAVVNGVRDIEGSVTLACKTERHQVSGKAWFQHCH
jgi:hypothetical protein